jgi:hypothetical protein
MSRTPSNSSLTVVTGATWDDYFDYFEDDGVTPIDLTGYEARMQVRTEKGAYGTTTTTTLLLELLSTGVAPKLFIEVPPGGTVKNRVRLRVAVDDHRVLNPDNVKRILRPYGMELYIPAGAEPEYVIPYVQGTVRVDGERVR